MGAKVTKEGDAHQIITFFIGNRRHYGKYLTSKCRRFINPRLNFSVNRKMSMAIKYEIIEDKRLVIAKGTGVVTGEDVIRHLGALAADERYVAPMKKLIDYTSIDDIRQSSEEIIILAEKKDSLKEKFAGERCAFVAPKDLFFGIARMFDAHIYNTDIKTQVFRRMEDALKWLDVELDMMSD